MLLTIQYKAKLKSALTLLCSRNTQGKVTRLYRICMTYSEELSVVFGSLNQLLFVILWHKILPIAANYYWIMDMPYKYVT